MKEEKETTITYTCSHSTYNLQMSFPANNKSRSTPLPLKRNNRFDCLNDSPIDDRASYRPRDNRRERMNAYNNNSSTPRTQESNILHGRYAFLSQKKEHTRKQRCLEFTEDKFPSLVDLRAPKKTKNSVPGIRDNNYKDAANYTEEQLLEIERKKQKNENTNKLEGWLTLSNSNGITIANEIDCNGEKRPLNNDDNYKNEYDHCLFQKECATAMYYNLTVMQHARDEENDILGQHSRYYGKGKLTDLSYLSDSDVESREENQDHSDSQEYYSDCDTY